MYGLIGEIVPDELLKECQRRLRQTQPGSRSEMDRREELETLDLIHRLRKAHSHAFSQLYAPGKWKEAKRVPPDAQMLSKGIRFWALLIGNNAYPKAPLGGCVNDVNLIKNYLKQYLNVPLDHIRALRDATRETLINAFYDLRDDERIKPDDNILIHFSGHGSSYDTRDYFTTFASKAGSIEAICPVDRGDSIPDISERELNSILSELRAAKGPNITIILDCCHAGGAVRSFDKSDTNAIRYIPPIRTGDALDLMRMFEAAERNPRRNPNFNVPNIFSDLWMPDLSSFVLLAACQDFQYAEESNFKEESSIRFPSEPDFKPDSEFKEEPSIHRPSEPNFKPDSDFKEESSIHRPSEPDFKPGSDFKDESPILLPSESNSESDFDSDFEPDFGPDFVYTYRGMMMPVVGRSSRPSPRHGRFTLALIKILESDLARMATYDSVITSIGRLGRMQVPLAVGSRKHARLWFEE